MATKHRPKAALPARPAPAEAAPPRSTGRPSVALPLIVAIVTLIAFAPCLGNGFAYDDVDMIQKNPNYRGLGVAQIEWAFSTFYMGHYQPLTWLTLGADYLLWGENPRGYHLTSMLLHALSAIVVFLIARRLFAAAMPAASRLALESGAVLAALLFSLHPLRVEPVAWVTDRADVLSTLFLLLCVWAYLRAHSADGPIRIAWRAASVALFALGLLSRGSGLLLPLVLLLLDWWPLRRVHGGRVGALLLEKVPYLLFTLLATILAPLAKADVRNLISIERHGPLSRLAQACYGLVFYPAKLLWPTDLVPIYELQPPLSFATPKYLVSLVAVLAAMVLLIVLLRRGRGVAITISTLAYVVLISPLLGLVQAGQQEVADRYAYFPALPWALLAGGGLTWAWLRRPRHAPAALGVLSLVVLAALAVTTWRQCTLWRSDPVLWSHALRHGPPSATVHFNMCCALAPQGRTQEALDHLYEALELRPQWAKARFFLGNGLREQGRLEEAQAAYEDVLRRQPTHAEAIEKLTQLYVERGNRAQQQGAFSDAEAFYEKCLALNPADENARCNLASALHQQGRTAEAVSQLQEVLRRNPDHPEAQRGLSMLAP